MVIGESISKTILGVFVTIYENGLHDAMRYSINNHVEDQVNVGLWIPLENKVPFFPDIVLVKYENNNGNR